MSKMCALLSWIAVNTTRAFFSWNSGLRVYDLGFRVLGQGDRG
jgi:hypothetical protein